MQVSHNFTIKSGAFIPPPEVEAAVMHFVPRKEPLIPVSKTWSKLGVTWIRVFWRSRCQFARLWTNLVEFKCCTHLFNLKVPFDHVEKLVRHVFSFRQKHCKRGLRWVLPLYAFTVSPKNKEKAKSSTNLRTAWEIAGKRQCKVGAWNCC